MGTKGSNERSHVIVNKLSSEEKIARALALLLVRDLGSNPEKALTLLGVGFDAPEIGEMLGVNKNYAHTVAHRQKTKQNTS